MKIHCTISITALALILFGCGGNSNGITSQAQAATITTGENSPLISDAQEFGDGLSILVLGSGDPVALLNGRASAGYLIVVDKKPVALMDAGGGTFQRLAKTNIDLKEVEIFLLSHLHIDHTADLPAIIKSLYFQNRIAKTLRTLPLHFFGPNGNSATFPGTDITQYPSMNEFIDGQFDAVRGIYRYLNIFTRAISSGEFAYTTQNLESNTDAESMTLIEENGLVIKSVAVNHGPVPAVAYRIEYGGKVIVYTGDTTSKTENIVNLARGADLLIYDAALLKDAPANPEEEIAFLLHTTPSRMGEVAAAAGVAKLLLSHIVTESEAELERAKELIRAKGYEGDIEIAKDLDIFNL